MQTIPEQHRRDVEALWDYHNLHHEPVRCDAGIGLGSHDIGVAEHAAELFHRGYFPVVVFTGANAPTTVDRFPRGEAVHYREHALRLGVPDSAILVEPRATNTGENIEFSKELLCRRLPGITSIMLICRPYHQRRAYATAKKHWPEVRITCSSQQVRLDEYLRRIGDVDRVISMLVGETQRVIRYAERGFTVRQSMPEQVVAAYRRLVEAGYTRRLIRD
ncbi:YdcF family protein [Saccharopolyspora rectivirgula]|jgi:uncharacterized SAM-binding protein YcdF (DUF218 family)|uniref:DUF218 domain-containing protein n=1 Tax=Saccharopolyspora rectivirgula TaxID=28042 RepID=A0A073AYH4_9PSEU|nr:YdcF family protein [Saccharopolyspora rectivirgula]KEI44097.1 hypothetical protein GU90_11500 [Saccharopolyspora rectivirgula]